MGIKVQILECKFAFANNLVTLQKLIRIYFKNSMATVQGLECLQHIGMRLEDIPEITKQKKISMAFKT